MTTTLQTRPTYYVGRNSRVNRRLGTLSPFQVASLSDMQDAVRTATAQSIWIASSDIDLCRYMRDLHWPVRHNLGSLLLLSTTVGANTLTPLLSVFHRIALPHPKSAVLSEEELAEVLTAPNRRDLAIAATYDSGTKTLTVWRGDFSRLVVPVSAFKVGTGNTEPDLRNIGITDCGQTVRLGSYEASVAALLYELDRDYRRRVARERRRKERGFGPSLRRLRLQKGLSRSAFHPLSEKTIARIERQEVRAIHAGTLNILASRLQVDPSDIGAY